MNCVSEKNGYTKGAKLSAGSFDRLGELLKINEIEFQPYLPEAGAIFSSETMTPDEEASLFSKAMADVTPLPECNRYYQQKILPLPSAAGDEDDEHDIEALMHLKNLVENGEGFVVENTPEYMEGRNANVSPVITRRLHRGDYSIQDYIDLHGFNVQEAWMAFDRFLKEAVAAGKRAVLIVHGRGLSSPVQPVLKNNVCKWLSQGRWRKWVMAFTSARSCDGGAGATYVLLRSRPVSRRMLKRKTKGAQLCRAS